MICDWCGKKISETKKTTSYHILKDYVHKPIVCNDCRKLIKDAPIFIKKKIK